MQQDCLATECDQAPQRSVNGSLPANAGDGNCPVNQLSDLAMLTKARVNVFVVGTVFVGFALHARIVSHWRLLLPAMIGAGLVAGAAAVANQLYEREFDRQMVRTRNRPLAAGRIRRRTALALTALLLGAGCLCLNNFVNPQATGLAVLTFVIYAFAYTPLKRCTPFCVMAGAVAGALPLLIGWAASGKEFGLWTGVAFGVLLLWQIPHFLAIAWRWRLDYSHAGYQVLPQNDSRGRRTAGWALAGAMATVAVSLLPVVLRGATGWYLYGGPVLGAVFLFYSIQFLLKRTEAAAGSLFVTSLVYLPCLYFLMVAGATRL